MKYLDLISLTTTHENTLRFLQEHNLIINNPMCIACHRPMHLENGKMRHGNNKRWRCSVRTCRKSMSVFMYSIFHNVHLPINHCLYIMYLIAMGISAKKIAFELGHKANYIALFINKIMKNVDTISINEYAEKLGGVNQIVEIDETHLVSRRDARGRILSGERYWVIGCIDRVSKEVRCILTRNRTRIICEQFLNDNVLTDTIIMSDKWRGYTNISRLGYTHHTVNHSIEFVDSINPNIHTQNIERFWRSLKESLPQSNSFDRLQLHVNRFVFEYNLKLRNAGEIFQCYLNLNKI